MKRDRRHIHEITIRLRCDEVPKLCKTPQDRFLVTLAALEWLTARCRDLALEASGKIRVGR